GDWKITFANTAATRMAGLGRDTFVAGKRLDAMRHKAIITHCVINLFRLPLPPSGRGLKLFIQNQSQPIY
ncbi:MAG: hypothetical protein ACQEQN_04935, partial [Thermodesulfobacteriota bacterium]